MDKVINVLKYVLYVFLVGCIGMIIWLCLYFALGWNKYTSITTNYVDKMTYVSEDTKYFIDINYLSNSNNNGKESFETTLNYYTDTALPEQNEDGTFKTDKYVYSSGIQFDGGFQYNVGGKTAWGSAMYDVKGHYQFYTVEPTNCYYYNIDNTVDTAFKSTNQLNNMNSWIYDLDGDLCQIKSVRTESMGTTNFIFSERRVCNINYCLLTLYESVKTLEDGIHIITFDLSRFFNIYMYNTNTGKFDISAKGGEEWTFVKVRINKDSNGLVDADQSMFKSFMGKPDWSLYDTTDSDYWQIDNVYNLTLKQLTFVYENGGYYLKVQDNVLSFLEGFDNMYFKLSLDLDKIYLGSEPLEIQGFSKNAFGELELAEISLTSESDRTFKVYDELLPITVTDNILLEVVA